MPHRRVSGYVPAASIALALLFSCAFPKEARGQTVIASPTRPTLSTALHATAGVFVSYGITADPAGHIVAERLTIWDAVQHTERVFSVGPAATLDGLPIRCELSKSPALDSNTLTVMRMQHMCTQLPKKLEPGKTWLVLIYWMPEKPKNDLQLRDTYPATDEIHVLEPVSPRPTD